MPWRDNTYKVVQSVSLANLKITKVNGFETVYLSRPVRVENGQYLGLATETGTSPLNLMCVDVKA